MTALLIPFYRDREVTLLPYARTVAVGRVQKLESVRKSGSGETVRTEGRINEVDLRLKDERM